ncbi:LemA family protein [Vitreoscilla massiliensis]|uniref:LemA family protein n=1 Tax=Vitreoscilla massiliensis TaxID=1689272 RepID=A0ABY4E640_9NEIS|nr:LemA family protein [Vitreoscilla massiliensis]UOO91253.1 LemA family protein [Vitreoscilla massiliensis]
MWVLMLVLMLILMLILVGLLVLGSQRFRRLQAQNHAVWLQVEAQLYRRYDWVPLWVQTAKCILKKELSALKAVIEARQAAQRALKNIKQQPEHSRAMQEWLRAEAHFTQCLRDLRTLVQTTPELRNHPDLLALRADLLLIEQDLSLSCQQYNHSAGFYNQYKHGFPSNVAALALGHTQDALLLPLEATIAFEPRSA